ncbi:MAG: histidine phosphatase family protein [Actinomycetes bacterium]
MDTAILARHGESRYSVRGLLNGDPGVAVGLTDAGVEQARALDAVLADESIDLCVTSSMERARATADAALGDRPVPRLVLPELNDPVYGVFEGRPLDEYRTWASAAPSTEAAPGGGESRYAIARRYAGAFRAIAALPDRTVLVVSHSLPVAYALLLRDGGQPVARVPLADYATPYRFTADELEAVVEALDAWLAAPDW